MNETIYHAAKPRGVCSSLYRRLTGSRRSGRLASTGLVGILLGTAAFMGQAATESDSFLVSATVAATCTITANDLAFGAYDPISGSALDGASTVDVTCTTGTTYDVGLDAGTTTGGTVSQRLLTDGTNTLDYNLYSDAGRTTVWGETISTDTVTGTGTGVLQMIDVFGQIPASQNVPNGTYTDTVNATITF